MEDNVKTVISKRMVNFNEVQAGMAAPQSLRVLNRIYASLKLFNVV